MRVSRLPSSRRLESRSPPSPFTTVYSACAIVRTGLFVCKIEGIVYNIVMSVRMRHTSSHTANRRSHHALLGLGLGKCDKCGLPKPAHKLCNNCGTYKGRTVTDVTAKLAKREKPARLNSRSGGKAKAKQKA